MRRILATLSVAALVLSGVTPVTVADPVRALDDAAAADLEAVDVDSVQSLSRASKPDLGTGTAPRTYLIELRDAAVPTYEGGKPGLARTAPLRGERLNPNSARARAYRQHLEDAQQAFIGRMERTVGRGVDVPFTYQYAVNGLAVVLTPAEAAEVMSDPAVASIALDVERELHTDAGPQWSGAEALWNAMAELGLPEDIRGEGIVIGTIDTGISPGNRSFAEVGDDGYVHENPLGEGNFLGVCDSAHPLFDPDFPCNNKLIGAYVFGGLNGNSALDYDGHGSHTSSTSGGNVLDDVIVETPTITTPPFDITGVAPHANVISYLGCCSVSGLTAAINQAIADEVDVINYSIGSSAPSQLWNDFDTVGFLNARAAGIFVATSNGNDGPGFATTGSPSDAPWITSVGASTHNRHNGNALTGLVSSVGTLPDIPGKSVTSALETPTPIVYAGDFGDALCGETTGNEANFTGRIVICDRGVFGRVQKSANVANQGAAGYVLVNDEVNGDSLLGDEYVVPGVFISHANGQTLKAWLAEGSDHVATVAGTTFVTDDVFGDIVTSFSSRGPNRAVDVIVPDVTAPGADILAATGADSYTVDTHGFISGTSMASPHVAGAGALLSQARPDWTPAQMQSALMTTARNTVLNHDGTPATPYVQGAGHINVGLAAQAGLLFDETHANYLAANPAEGGDPKTLNLPSFANTQCLQICSWDRTAAAPSSAPPSVTWSVSTTADPGLTLGVDLSPATVSPGDSMSLGVAANVAGAPEGQTLFGRVTLTPSDPDVPTVTMPLAVVPTAGVLPGSVEIETRRDAGSYLVSGIESIEVTNFTGSVAGMVAATLDEGSLVQDPTRNDPYDDLSQVDVYVVEVPAGSARLVAESIEWEMPDLDLYVGTGTTPSAATEVCSSTSPASAERCDIADPAPGTWWVLIQNWAGTTPTNPDAYTLATAVVPGASLGNAGIDGPAGPVPAGEPYDIRIHWEIPDMVAGDRWYGTAILGSSPASPGDIGSFPVTLVRVEDDVTKSASVETAGPGETVTYEITVQPNVTPEDLEYTITDTIPDGLTYVEGSVTGGATVTDGVVSWTGTMPTAVGAEGDYVVATSDTDASCETPFGDGGYIDFRPFGIFPNPNVSGDTVAFTAFASGSPFQFYGNDHVGMGFTDDGFAIFDAAANYGGQPWNPQLVPNPALPNNLIGLLWHDYEIVYDAATDRGVSLVTLGGDAPTAYAIVDYRDVQLFQEPAGPRYTFQIWVRRTPLSGGWEVAIAYDNLGPLDGAFTVATENRLGTSATALVNQASAEGAISSDTVVCFAYEGPSFAPHVITYDVTVDATPTGGTLTNEAVHVTDDPFAQPAVASFDLEVTAGTIEAITVSPASARLRPGQTQQFMATGHLDDGGTVDVTDSATWTSGNESVVTVEAGGLATGVGGGKTSVTASFGGVSGSAAVHVTGKPADKGPGPRIATTDLPVANVFQTYEASLAAERGTPPYTWEANALPKRA